MSQVLLIMAFHAALATTPVVFASCSGKTTFRTSARKSCLLPCGKNGSGNIPAVAQALCVFPGWRNNDGTDATLAVEVHFPDRCARPLKV